MNSKRKEFLSSLEVEMDKNISDIIRNQKKAKEIISLSLSKKSQEEVEKRLKELRPWLEEDIEL